MKTNHKLKLSPLVGAVVLALSAPLAMAATAPAAGSLPGAFVTNNSAVTYSAATGVTNAATITVPSSGAVVLQWGGAGDIASPTTIAAPSALTTNAGFDIGAGGTLTLGGAPGTAASTTPVLINDITGQPSQIYGSFSVASGSTAVPVFIANANGIIVGSGATINTPTTGTISLVGYAQDPGAFAGSVAVNSATITNGGTVSVMPGASVTAGYLLVAGGGNVNVGVAPSSSLAVLGGSAFTVGSSGAVSAGGAINTSAVVNFDNVSGTITPTLVDAAGAVNVAASALVNLSSGTTIGGALTNAGNVTLPNALTVTSFLNNGIAVASGTTASITASAGNITNNGALSDTTSATGGFNLLATGAGGSVVNNGVINVQTAGTLKLQATKGGTVTNNGVINFYAPNATSGATSFSAAGSTGQTNPNYLDVSAQNVNMYGVVNQATSAGATPTALYLNATGGINAIAGASIAASTSGGVLNFGTTIVTVSDQTNPDLLQGDAVRILSGRFANRNIFNQGYNGELIVKVGSGAVGNYGYNLSVFPGAIIQAWHLNVSGSATTNGSNINLDGTIQSNNAVVTADNINAASYVAGGPNGSNGFRIMANSASGTTPPTDGSLLLNVAGNVNNPQGAAAAGQPASAFQYNGVPVTVFGGDGTSYISVMPTNTANAPQMVNLLVNGSAILGNSGVSNAGSSFGLGGSIVPASSYPNSHLVVSATGNLTFGGSINSFWATATGGSTLPSSATAYAPVTAPYYWPGLMVFSNVVSAADPTSVGLGTMTLDAHLSNLLPTNVSGNGGIFFNTNGLIAGLSSTNYVLTNSNSWINFPASGAGSLIAAQYRSNNATNMDFYGATTNANASSLLTSQVLPASDIVSR